MGRDHRRVDCRGMAVISRSHRLLFILAPHTGSSAIAKVLKEELTGEWIPPREIQDADGRILARRKHTTMRQLLTAGLISAAERADLFAFSAVRNPFDALVSTYFKHASAEPTTIAKRRSTGRSRIVDFAEFCQDHSFEEWIDYAFKPGTLDRLRGRAAQQGPSYHDDVDFIMRFEHLQHDFDEALRRGGIEGSYVIPRHNVTQERQTRDYREFYSEGSRRVVQQAFAPYLERFGYSF